MNEGEIFFIYSLNAIFARHTTMGYIELIFLAVGLSMDAWATAICKGLSARRFEAKHALLTGFLFGIFQAGMPLLGYILGQSFEHHIQRVDHWIAFILLSLIGLNMIRASRKPPRISNDSFSLRVLLPLALATSIDALAAGVTLAFLPVRIWVAVTLIGIMTFVLSALGVWIGQLLGRRFKSGAELAGGIVLLVLGGKILLEHLGIIG